MLSVGSPAAARSALDAAESAVVVDGRTTAWNVLAALGNAGAFAAMIAILRRDDVPFFVAYLVFVALFVLSDICERASGVQRHPARGRVVVVALVVGLSAVAAMIVLDLPTSWFLGFLAACVLGAAVAPVLGWARSRGRGAPSAWAPGSEAFAILTLLDAAAAFTPVRLGARVGLDPQSTNWWIERLRAEHLLMGGRERRWPLRREWVQITQTGRERLALMRAELEDQAAGVPVA